MSQWRVLIAETLTGTVVADVAHSGMPQFTRRLSDPGSLTVNLFIDSAPNRGTDFHTFTRSGKYSWVLAWGDYIAQAGPVWSYRFTDESRELSVTCGGLFSLFSRRVTRNPNGHTAIVHPSEDLHYTGQTLRNIMGSLMADNMAQHNFGLPIVLPPADASGTHERHYYGHELKPVADNVTELSEVDEGPEFDLAPEFINGGTGIQWRLHVGAPLLGDQASNATWDYGSAIDTIDVDVNGSAAPVSRVWVKGNGSERGLLTGFASTETPAQRGYPAMDYVDTEHTSTTEQATLEAYADAGLAEFAAATEQWECAARIVGGHGVEYSPALGHWELGDAPVFFVGRHPWLPSGAYRRRITGFTNDSPSTVKLELAETREVA